MKTKVSGKNVALMVAPVALVIGAVVVTPVVSDHLAERRENLDRVRAEKEALYKARLQPCPEGTYHPGQEAIALRQGEIRVDIFPAFDPPEGFSLSSTALSGYSGMTGVSYPPPPPPPPGVVAVPGSLTNTTPRFMQRPPVALDQEVADRALRILRMEIAEADAERYLGLDGVGYVLRHGDKCATTWSPEPDTRAYKIVELIHALNELSTKKSDDTGALQEEIVRWTSELDVDRRELLD